MKRRQAENFSVFSAQSLQSIRGTISLHLRWLPARKKHSLF